MPCFFIRKINPILFIRTGSKGFWKLENCKGGKVKVEAGWMLKM